MSAMVARLFRVLCCLAVLCSTPLAFAQDATVYEGRISGQELTYDAADRVLKTVRFDGLLAARITDLGVAVRLEDAGPLSGKGRLRLELDERLQPVAANVYSGTGTIRLRTAEGEDVFGIRMTVRVRGTGDRRRLVGQFFTNRARSVENDPEGPTREYVSGRVLASVTR